MLKAFVLILLIASVLTQCPHMLKKRQIGRRPPPPAQQKQRPPQPEDDRRPRPPSPPPAPITSCDPDAKYSSIDGSCNNLENPTLGRAETSFKRYLPAEYEDNISAPRTRSINGKPLPNPRTISRALMNDNEAFENNYSDLLVYFGQFLAHDLTEFKINDVECPCGSTNPLCLSYSLPNGDEKISQSCFEFPRAQFSESTFTDGIEQINFLTSFIDGTQVYGPSKDVSDQLRTFQRGLLATSPGDYLPTSDDHKCDPDGELDCFVSGDDRTSENLALTGLHLTFMREHNRIARRLARVNTAWDDETLFQEARRINIASMQHIIYKEWLPTVIGKSSQLLPLDSGYYNGYDRNVNPALANEFATSAFRFGHTLIRQQLDRYNFQHNLVASTVNLSAIIFNSNEAYNNEGGLGGIEKIFMGLLQQPTSKFDASFVDTLQNRLFETTDESGNVVALDLAATNINRGRDMALPAYYKYRELCGSRRIDKFEDLRDVMTTSNIQNLRGIYSSVKDIDLFVGGLHETPDNGALVGPTVACILEKQFRDLKKGDRFYYENGPAPTSFTSNQLDQIRRTSMANVICRNFAVNSVQPNAFKMAYAELDNTRTNCRNIRDIDFSQWRV